MTKLTPRKIGCSLTTALLGLAILLFLAAPAVAVVPAPTFWITMSHPSGVAATQFRLLVTSQDDETHVFLVDALGFQHPFGTLPAQPPGSPSVQEIYLAISPGLGGFTANDVYACRGNQVLTIPKAGGAGSVFADFSTNGVPNASHCGIVFDETGAFGDNLIVTFQDGSVWEVTSAGTKTLLATLDNGPAEGPNINASGTPC